TFLIQTTQLPKGVSHSYELGIVQTRRYWKENSRIFPTVSENTPNHPELGVMVV
ncbi:hypothetical protein MTR67_030205, partial [Solanum verrucosum]